MVQSCYLKSFKSFGAVLNFQTIQKQEQMFKTENKRERELYLLGRPSSSSQPAGPAHFPFSYLSPTLRAGHHACTPWPLDDQRAAGTVPRERIRLGRTPLSLTLILTPLLSISLPWQRSSP